MKEDNNMFEYIFEEKCFMKAAKNMLKKQEFFVTEKKLKNVRILFVDVKKENISLNDLRLLPNLECLYLDKKDGKFNISDLSPLNYVPNLQELSFRNVYLKYAGLTNEYFKNIYSLEFISTDIENFSFLRNLPKLKELVIGESYIKSLSFLKNLLSLTSLEIDCMNLDDISDIKYLINLNDIILYNTNKIKDYSVLKKLSKLQLYSIEDNTYDINDENGVLFKL